MTAAYHSREHESQAENSAIPGSYIRNDSPNITESYNLFLCSIVTRRGKPKTTFFEEAAHTSSSDPTHGGGDGKL